MSEYSKWPKGKIPIFLVLGMWQQYHPLHCDCIFGLKQANLQGERDEERQERYALTLAGLGLASDNAVPRPMFTAGISWFQS